jgi:hypothetical protein
MMPQLDWTYMLPVWQHLQIEWAVLLSVSVVLQLVPICAEFGEVRQLRGSNLVYGFSSFDNKASPYTGYAYE